MLLLAFLKYYIQSETLSDQCNMSYTTREAVWPQGPAMLDERTKDLIARFYELIDSKSSDAGPRLASEVFTKSAYFGGGTGTFQGYERKETAAMAVKFHFDPKTGYAHFRGERRLIYSIEIARSRDNVWKDLAERQHTISRVYTIDNACVDLMVNGSCKTTYKTEKVEVTQFAARLVLKRSEDEGPSIELMQVYVVRTSSSHTLRDIPSRYAIYRVINEDTCC